MTAVSALREASFRTCEVRKERPAAHEATGDTLALSILSNVKLTISATWANNEVSGIFKITGPQNTLEMLLRLVDDDNPCCMAFCRRPRLSQCQWSAVATLASPRSSLILLYPSAGDDEVESLKLLDTWAFVLLAGGYAYFDDSQQLLRSMPSPTRPRRPVWSWSGILSMAKLPAARSMLQKQSRFMPIADEAFSAQASMRFAGCTHLKPLTVR